MGPLIGRQRDLDVAWAHLTASSAPNGDAAIAAARMIVIEGAAGIGKSAFVAAVVERAVEQGAAAVAVALSPVETPITWAGVSSLCGGPLRAHLHALPTAPARALACALGSEVGEAEPILVASALATLIAEHLHRHGEVVLVLDDLHALDVASAGALAFAIRVNADLRLRVVAATRPGHGPVDPTRSLPEGASLRIELDGLDVQGLQTLLAERFGVVHRGAELARLHEVTGGNPLYALEIGRLVATGHLLDDASVPASLDALIDAHVGSLPMDALELVGAVALLVSPTVSFLARIFPGLDDALVVAEDAGVVASKGDVIRFTHPLLRAGTLHRLGGTRRRRLAARLAEIVTDPDERARLLAEAATGRDDTVAELLDAAGAAALARGAPHVAVERYSRAVELGGAEGPAAAHRRLELGRACALTGDVDRSIEQLQVALAGELDPPACASAVSLLATAMHLRDGLDASVDVLAVGAERLRGAPVARLRVLTTWAYVLVATDLRAANEVTAALVDEAAATGDVDAETTAFFAHARVTFLRGWPVDLDDIVARVTERARADDVAANDPIIVFLCELLCWGDRPEAIEIERVELERCRRHGHLPGEANALASLSDSLRRAGRWDEALAMAQAWVRVAQLQGHAPEEEGDACELAWLLGARGEADAAWRIATAAVEGTKAVPLWHVQATARGGSIALMNGHPAAAVELLTIARERADAAGLEDLSSLTFRDELVEALVLSGRLEAAAVEARRFEALAERSGRLRGRVGAARARALVEAADGRLDAAEAAVVSGLTVVTQLGDPFEHARLLLVGGTIARRAGRRTQSRDRLDEARQLFEGLGAAPFVARVDAELARLGDRTGRRDQLTHTERQVAELVAGGRSNADTAAELFITVRTVEAHLTRIYRKVGVRSRAELIAKRAELDLA